MIEQVLSQYYWLNIIPTSLLFSIMIEPEQALAFLEEVLLLQVASWIPR